MDSRSAATPFAVDMESLTAERLPSAPTHKKWHAERGNEGGKREREGYFHLVPTQSVGTRYYEMAPAVTSTKPPGSLASTTVGV